MSVSDNKETTPNFDILSPRKIYLRASANIMLFVVFGATSTYAMGSDIKMVPNLYHECIQPGPQDVTISGASIIVPFGRILLIRNGSEYGAIKFTKFWWKGKDAQTYDYYSSYESYYQGDGSGNFAKNNVKYKERTASLLHYPVIGSVCIRIQFGNPKIQCGNIKLIWSPRAVVSFFRFDKPERLDLRVELAPTPWTTISEVNVFDPRVKWYQYDLKTTCYNIPIDKLWNSVSGEHGGRP